MERKHRGVAVASSIVLGAALLLEEVMARIADRFARVETRRTARTFLEALTSELPSKNCWTMSEHAGHKTPDKMQHLLARASWDHDGVRDELRDFTLGELGREDALLIIDETGDQKKGTATAGVQRQYTGTAGRIENAQVAVYLTYSTNTGRTFIDGELYLPTSWTDDDARTAAAGVPGDVEFASKPTLAKNMLIRAFEAGVRAPWVTGDEVYGADPGLRRELESRGVGYVMAIACNRTVDTARGRLRADELLAKVPRHRWKTLSAGDGTKGPRFYDWTWIPIHPDPDPNLRPGAPGRRWLLIRRNNHTGEIAYYRCYSPKSVPLRVLVRVAGRRWGIETNFQTIKGLCGLDQHQVRTWTSWRRWIILAMLAHALLTVLAALERARDPAPDGMIPLTTNEVRHLIAVSITTNTDIEARLRRSTWRRRHQHRAKISHYQRRSTEAA